MSRKKAILSGLFILFITGIAIFFNWENCIFGNKVTKTNTNVSIIFLLLWLGFSFYWGFMQERKFKKFILIYWGINLISFLLIGYLVSINAGEMIFLPFLMWYGVPVFGLESLFKSYTAFYIGTAPIGFVLSFIGYYLGFFLSKNLKTAK